MRDERPPLLARALLALYQGTLSPALHALSPSRCQYLPTCSEYAYVATARFGLVRGGWMTLLRLLRCHPLAEGGLDPVPSAPAGTNRLP
jgi:putative membrane protein insertion efficiency factor